MDSTEGDTQGGDGAAAEAGVGGTVPLRVRVQPKAPRGETWGAHNRRTRRATRHTRRLLKRSPRNRTGSSTSDDAAGPGAESGDAVASGHDGSGGGSLHGKSNGTTNSDTNGNTSGAEEGARPNKVALVSALRKPAKKPPPVKEFVPSPLLPRRVKVMQKRVWQDKHGGGGGRRRRGSRRSSGAGGLMATLGRMGGGEGGGDGQFERQLTWDADLEDAFKEFEAAVLVDRPESYTASTVTRAHVRIEDFLRSQQFKAWFTTLAPSWLVKAQAMRLSQAASEGRSDHQVRCCCMSRRGGS